MTVKELRMLLDFFDDDDVVYVYKILGGISRQPAILHGAFGQPTLTCEEWLGEGNDCKASE